jgi:hypothetical protein
VLSHAWLEAMVYSNVQFKETIHSNNLLSAPSFTRSTHSARSNWALNHGCDAAPGSYTAKKNQKSGEWRGTSSSRASCGALSIRLYETHSSSLALSFLFFFLWHVFVQRRPLFSRLLEIKSAVQSLYPCIHLSTGALKRSLRPPRHSSTVNTALYHSLIQVHSV